ncbi:MAG: hypothetical protein OHK0023_24610 [Anaerolineae bacterium]
MNDLAWQRRIGILQTIIVVMILIQIIFAGVLRLFPPEVRKQVAFLHRVEWAVYSLIVLIAAHIAISVQSRQVVTNRAFLLGLRLGKERIVTGRAARLVQIAFAIVVIMLIVASLWVRARGFLVQPPAV